MPSRGQFAIVLEQAVQTKQRWATQISSTSTFHSNSGTAAVQQM